ncbi:MAG: trypsin-like peptidase domain-containing protein [Pseudobdellovibrionaceae bacterium]
MLRAFFLLAILVTSAHAFAFNCMHRGLQEQVFKDLIVPVAVHEEEDTRRVEEDYATDHSVDPQTIRDRFAATGQLLCGGYKGSASLVGSSGTIVTTAHTFFNKKTCAEINKPSDCTFVTISKGVTVSIPVGSSVEMGFKCPQKPGPEDDWAVLKLQRKATGIKAYSLPFGEVKLRRGQGVIAVNGRNADIFYSDKNGKKIHPKTVQDCYSGENYYSSNRFSMFESTCASSEGTSGSAIVQSSSFGDVFTGLTTGNFERIEDSRAAIARGEKNMGVYVPGKWASTHIPVTDKFLAAIRLAGTLDPK